MVPPKKNLKNLITQIFVKTQKEFFFFFFLQFFVIKHLAKNFKAFDILIKFTL